MFPADRPFPGLSISAVAILWAALSAVPAPANVPVVASAVKPVRIVQTASGSDRVYLVDFGWTRFGSLSFRLNNTGASQSGQIAISEAVSATDLVTNLVGARSSTATLSIAAGNQAYSQFTDQPIRACRIRIPASGVSLDTAGIVLNAKHVAFDDSASAFVSSDTTLNRVYQFCKHSVKATSFLGVYIDGIRETKPYEGDAYINMLSHFAADANPPVALFTHEYLLTHPTWPWEYRLISILIGWELYMATGDIDQLQRNYATLTGRIQSCIGSGSWSDSLALADWPIAMRDGLDSTRRGNVVTNAWVYKALMTIADMADALAKPSEASAFRTRAAQTKKRLNDSLFMKDQGVYRDAMGTNHTSLHGNLYPLALGLVPDSLKAGVAQFLAKKGMACNVYAAQFLLDGLFDAGQDSAAIALMTAKTGNSWGHMLYEIGSTITMEVWDPKQKPNLDWNHAWATAPANVIPRRLFGILPLSPGYARFQVKPRVGTLASGRYVQPTVKGNIAVAFESRRGQSLSLAVTVPAGARAKVYVPTFGSGDNEVLVDNQKRTGTREGDFLAIDSLPPGDHALARTLPGTALPRMRASFGAGLRILPGPGSARFRLADRQAGPSRIAVTDASGKRVSEFVLEGAGERIVALAPGLYFASARSQGREPAAAAAPPIRSKFVVR